MGRYIARRLLQALPVFFGTTFLIFALVFAIPGDPIRALSGDKPISPSVYAELRGAVQPRRPLPGPVRQVHGQPVPGRLRPELPRP